MSRWIQNLLKRMLRNWITCDPYPCFRQSQADYQLDWGAIEQAFALCQLIEKSKEFKKSIHTVFIDLIKGLTAPNWINFGQFSKWIPSREFQYVYNNSTNAIKSYHGANCFVLIKENFKERDMLSAILFELTCLI